MKQLILSLVLLLCLAGCKKDDSHPTTILLNEVSTDGVVTTRMQYSADNRLTRYESYGGGVINAYIKAEYDGSGHIIRMGSYTMPGDVPAVKIEFQCDADGKITTSTNYDLAGPTPNTPVAVTTRSYNAQGILIKADNKDHNGNLIARQNFLYFPDGNLKETQTFKENNGQLWMSGKSVYAITNGFYPKGTDQLRAIFGPEILANFFSESIQGYTYDQNGGIITQRSQVMSAREYNDDGTLKKQVQTYKSIKPPQPEVVTNQQFAYVIQ
jgi:hypothetical protein